MVFEMVYKTEKIVCDYCGKLIGKTEFETKESHDQFEFEKNEEYDTKDFRIVCLDCQGK